MILKKSLYEEIPQKVIKCDGITSECINSQMIIDEEFGYVLTGSGIYGGKLDADRWEKILRQLAADLEGEGSPSRHSAV